MDTRFWGPSGWRLLHTITFAYIPRTDKVAVREMFTLLPFVLPCKYCRTSLAEYMDRHLLESALESRETLTKWLWKIHNEVNSKLRNQKIPVEPDPPFQDVLKFYQDILATGCSKTEFPGWDFLFSIAEGFNIPLGLIIHLDLLKHLDKIIGIILELNEKKPLI